jgi:hypothetical protein
VTRHGPAAEGADLEAADSVATSVAADSAEVVIPAAADSMLLREGSAVVVPLTSIVEGCISLSLAPDNFGLMDIWCVPPEGLIAG